MVDPYQVLIDNGNGTSTNFDTPKLSINSTKNMNESDTSQHQLIQQQQQLQQQSEIKNSITTTAATATNNAIEVIKRNEVFFECVKDGYNQQDCFSEIMCGPSDKHGTNSQITTTTTTTTNANNASDNNLIECTENAVIFQNGDLALSDITKHFTENIEQTLNVNKNIDNNTLISAPTDLLIGSNNPVCINANDKSLLSESYANHDDDDSTNIDFVTEHLNSAQHSLIAINAVPEQQNQTTTTGEPIFSSTTIEHSADTLQTFSAEFQTTSTTTIASNRNISIDHTIAPAVSVTAIEMDSRKVEPLRININREPIKTKIKLSDRQASSMSPSSTKYTTTILPKSSSAAANATLSESDEVDEAMHEAQPLPTIPKITIKPIAKPPSESLNNAKKIMQNSTLSALLADKGQQKRPSSTDDDFVQSTTESLKTIVASDGVNRPTIPKLKIKKVDSISSTLENISNYNANSNIISHAVLSSNSDASNSGNSLHHNQLPESYSVPKLTTASRSSTKNLSIDSNSGNEDLFDEDSGGSAINSTKSSNKASTSSNELVPKLTIKLDNHHHQHGAAVQNDSTYKEVSLVSAAGVKVTLKPIAEPPLPKFTIKTNTLNDTAKVIIVNNASNEQTDESSDEQIQSQPPSCQPSPNKYPAHAISSSTSSNSSNSAHNNEDNLSTCSSGSSSSFTSSTSSISGFNNDIKLIIKATSTGSCVVSPNTTSVVRNSSSNKSSKTNSEQSKQNNITSSLVTSSTSSGDAIPKINIKLSNTDYPQLIHADSDRSESPLPKLTIRKTMASDDSSGIPKVTIKSVVKPNEYTDSVSADTSTSSTSVKTPKITFKPIPKPIDKPLEIITAPGSPFRSSSENESQQSPRIILKINKNVTSQTKEASLSSTTIIADDSTGRSDSPIVTSHNELKRSNYDSDIQAKKQKLVATEIVQLLSSDSEPEDSNHTSIENNNHDNGSMEMPQSNLLTIPSIEKSTIVTNTPSYDSNSGLRSILSRPQMKIQPQPIQNFLQTLPPFKSTVTSENSESKTNDIIDLCHDSNDHLLDQQSNDESNAEPMATTQNEIPNETTANTNQNNVEQKKTTATSGYNWQQIFYGREREEPQDVHPLLQQNIERANILAAMMEAQNNVEKGLHASNGSNNNNSTGKDDFDKTLSNQPNSLLDNDGSSSDCIMIEDTGSEPFPAVDYASGEPTIEQNSQKKDSMDRDSGVDVSSSIKSASGDGHDDEIALSAKRPRGRPRKGPPKVDK